MGEVETVKQALEQAIRMEVEGRRFYLESAQKGSHPLAQKLFQALAKEEDVHRKTAEELFLALKAQASWPDTAVHVSTGADLKTVFTEAIQSGGPKASASETDAFKVAMDMEQKSFDFYKDCEAKATFPKEEQFYQALMREERGHFFVLFDSLEYLQDPQGWFVKKEHHGLDGG
ncbi:MAG: ferritin family protein [Dehalococcoidia bacterium]|nr:ferritin family protein [Dehalococcoidia bacterium]